MQQSNRTALSAMFAAGALACALTLGAAGSAFAVSARPVVAPPAPNTAPPSTVYGQNGQSLPAPGITVREKKSVDQQVQDAADDLDDYGNGPTQSIADPFEPWNRFWFGFNDIFYMYVADPAYKAWEAITPHQLRKGLHNFWHNLLFPVRFINNLLQLRFKEAGVEFGRFIINTTAGVGGLVDVAKNKKTIVPVDPWYVPSAVSAGFFFNDLDQVLPTYFDLKKAAVDPYIMMREAYVKYRAIQVAR